MLDPVIVAENEIDTTGATWWWNMKMARGDQMRGDELYYPDQETLGKYKGNPVTDQYCLSFKLFKKQSH